MFWDDDVRGRIVRKDGELWFYYYDGTYIKANGDVIKNILLGFRERYGLGGYEHHWSIDAFDTVMGVPGETLLVFTDKSIEIFDPSVFNKVIAQGNPLEYVSVAKYAEIHHCSTARIKKLCLEGRISGSIKISGKWFIYRYADYPADRRKYNGNKKTKDKI